MDKDGNVVGTRTGLTDKEARYKQSKNIGEFGRTLMYDARDEEDIKQDVKKSQLKQKVDDVRQLMTDVDLEVSGLLNQRVGTEKFVLKPEDLRGEDKKRYEVLEAKRKELKKDLILAQQAFNDFKPTAYEDVQLYDIFNGKFVDGLEQMSEEGRAFQSEREKIKNENQGTDLNSLEESRNAAYYTLLDIAKKVKQNKDDVASDRYMFQKMAEGLESLISLTDSKGDDSFLDVVETFPNANDKDFGSNFVGAYTIKSSHPLAKEYNQALNTFYALNDAVELNRNTAVAGSDYDNTWKSGAAFVEGFGQMFYGPGAGYDSYKTSVKQPFVNAVKGIGLSGEEVEKMEEAVEKTWGEETATIGGNITGMVMQLAGPGGVLKAAKIPQLIKAGQIITTAKYGRIPGAAYSMLTSGGLEAGKFYLTGKLYNNEEYYDPALGFAFGALTPISQLGSKLLSKVPGAQVVDQALTNAMPRIYSGGKFLGGKAGQATAGVGIAYAAEIADKVAFKGHELGESWDEVIYGVTDANPEGVDPIRKASSLWAVMFASGLSNKESYKEFHQKLTQDLKAAKYRKVNAEVLKNAEQIEKSGTAEEKQQLKEARINANFNAELKGIKTQIDDIAAAEKKAEIQTDAVKSIVEQIVKKPKRPPAEPGGAGDVILDVALSKEQIQSLNDASPLELQNISELVKQSVKNKNLTKEQGMDVINKITEIRNQRDKIGTENNKLASEVQEVQNKKEKVDKEIKSMEEMTFKDKNTQNKETELKNESKQLDGELNELANREETPQELAEDLVNNPGRQEKTIRNPEWQKQNPEFMKELAQKTDALTGENKTINEALTEMSTGETTQPAKEVGEVTVSGTFDGFKFEGKEVPDLRQEARGNDGKIIETTNKAGEKIFTLVKETFDAVGREGYMGVSITLPKGSKAKAKDVKQQLEFQMEKVSKGQDLSGKSIKNIGELDVTKIDKDLTVTTIEDAVQKSSPKKVDVLEQPRDGKTMGERDTKVEEITEEVKQEEVETEPQKKTKIKDSQTPVEKETFTIEREGPDGNTYTSKVEVITNKDGSRTFTERDSQGQPFNVARVGKENTLSNKEYVESAYEDVVGESTVVKGTENINPKIAERVKQETVEVTEEVTPVKTKAKPKSKVPRRKGFKPQTKKVLDVRLEPLKPGEKAIVKDSQIPLEKETFSVETEPGEGKMVVEITTNKDGSRTVRQKIDGKVAGSARINKNNTLSNKEYVENSYTEKKGEKVESIKKVKGANNIMTESAKKKLTTEQRKELGIKTKEAPKTKRVRRGEKPTLKASDLYKQLQQKGVSPEDAVKSLKDAGFNDSVIKTTLNQAGIDYSATLRGKSQIEQLKKDLQIQEKGARQALKLNKETVKRVTDILREINKEIKSVDPKFSTKISNTIKELKRTAQKDLTVDKADKIVAEAEAAIKKLGKDSMIKSIKRNVSAAIKGRKGKPITSVDAQRAMNEVSTMIEGVDLKNGTYEQVKAIAEYVKQIETKGKAEKSVRDAALRAEKSITEGTAAESLYKDSPATELKTEAEIKDFLDKGDRLVVIDGKLVTKSQLTQFMKDNPGVDLTNAKGYENVKVSTVKNNIANARSNKPGIFTKDFWRAQLIKTKAALDPTKSVANVETILTRLKKGESPEFKKQIDDLIENITEEADLRVEERRGEFKEKTDKIFNDSFGSTSKGNKRLNEEVPGNPYTEAGNNTKMTNGNAVDLYIVDKVNLRKAEQLRAEAAKTTNAKQKKAKLEKAKDLENVVENSGVDIKKVREHIEKNKDLKDFADNTLEFFNEAGFEFEQLAEDVTGKPFLNPNYYPMYKKGGVETQRAEVKTEDAILRGQGEGEFAQRSAMTDRLKPADPLNTQSIDINTDVRAKLQEYVESMIHAEQYVPISKKVNQIVNPHTKGKILEKLGEADYYNLMDNLDAVIDRNYSGKVTQSEGKTMETVNKLNRIGIVLNLALKPANFVKQLTSATHWGYAGLKDGITTAEVWAQMPQIPLSKELLKVSYDIATSPFIRDRIRKSDIDPVLKNQLLDIKNQPHEVAWKTIQQTLMSPIIGGDIAGVLGGGIPYAVAKYRQVKKTTKGEFDAKAYREAYKRFRKEASTAQQSGKAFTTGIIQRRGIGKLLTTYKTSQTQAFNKMMQGWSEMTDKTNSAAQRRKGFFQWQKFMRASLLFQGVGTGFAYSLISGAASEEDKAEQQLFETVMGTLEGVFQGAGPIGYLPLVVTNYAQGRPLDWNLPPVVTTLYSGVKNINQAMKILSGEKDFDELTDVEKKDLIPFFKKFEELGDIGEMEDFIKIMLSGKDKSYRNPLYETLVKGEDFETDEYITIKKPRKKDDTPKTLEEARKQRRKSLYGGGKPDRRTKEGKEQPMTLEEARKKRKKELGL